ncbi:MAG: hypothetical protein AB7G47_15170 [Mycolicibacterium sp.]|uniref:hypothetical protein n=1 Tax=Mycolicibacterium sp. TaxID=2320850 RepID=UPI003D0D72FE
MTNDVEKRFDRPGSFRAAATYTLVVVALAGVAFAFYAFGDRTSVFSAVLVPVFLFLGGVGALVKTYREWKAEGGWVAWQGAGWLLLLMMLFALAIPGSAYLVGGVE